MKTNYFMTTDVLVVADFLQGATVVAFDFETAPMASWRDDGTAALDPHRGEIVGVSMAVAPTMDDISGGKAIYIPLGHHDPDGVGLNAAADATLAALHPEEGIGPAVIHQLSQPDPSAPTIPAICRRSRSALIMIPAPPPRGLWRFSDSAWTRPPSGWYRSCSVIC